MKFADKLTEDDLRTNPVWRFAETGEDEMLVAPVLDLPVSDLEGCIVGVELELATGGILFAGLSNISLKSRLATDQFLIAVFFINGQRYRLARYFDEDWEHNGPAAFAASLGRDVRSIFPLRYDVSPFCIGDQHFLSGTIEAEPAARLSEEQRLDLIMSGISFP